MRSSGGPSPSGRAIARCTAQRSCRCDPRSIQTTRRASQGCSQHSCNIRVDALRIRVDRGLALESVLVSTLLLRVHPHRSRTQIPSAISKPTPCLTEIAGQLASRGQSRRRALPVQATCVLNIRSRHELASGSRVRAHRPRPGLRELYTALLTQRAGSHPGRDMCGMVSHGAFAPDIRHETEFTPRTRLTSRHPGIRNQKQNNKRLVAGGKFSSSAEVTLWQRSRTRPSKRNEREAACRRGRVWRCSSRSGED